MQTRSFFAPGALVLTLVMACGPGGRGDDDGDTGGDTGDGGGTPDASGPVGPQGQITGRVWMPGSAPGMVPTGEEIPVSEALVYVQTGPLPAIPQETYCDQCEQPGGYHTLSDAKGAFALNVGPGTYYLAIQKGQFRLDQMVTIGEDEIVALTDAQTTLPNDHDPAAGKWLPRVAVATGNYDELEIIFGKLGIGMLDSLGGWNGSSAADNIDIWDNDTGGAAVGSLGDFSELLLDLTKMKQYHIIIVPCADSEPFGTGPSDSAATQALFTNPVVRQNITEFVRLGGKLYVTDWASEFEDVVWPEFIKFHSAHDTAVADCTGAACNYGDGWGPNDPGGTGVGSGYLSEHSKAVDPKLNAWLDGQMAPDSSNTSVTAVDADHFEAEDNYNAIMELGSIQIGVDDEGLPIIETPYAYVLGEHTAGQGPIKPLTVTFEPIGCGRVLYTSYHTTPSRHDGLVAQERVLLYLLGEIGVCKDGPIVE